MAEYIEKQALLKKMYASHSVPLLISQTTDEDIMFKTMVSIVGEQPTADVVEVVHCRDCKHLYELSAIDRRFYCRHHPQGLTGINIIEDNPYCSYGERKCDNG